MAEIMRNLISNNYKNSSSNEDSSSCLPSWIQHTRQYNGWMEIKGKNTKYFKLNIFLYQIYMTWPTYNIIKYHCIYLNSITKKFGSTICSSSKILKLFIEIPFYIEYNRIKIQNETYILKIHSQFNNCCISICFG